MTPQLEPIMKELLKFGAVKVILEDYNAAWLLRNKVNGELRQTSTKDKFTSAVIDSTLIVWKVKRFGKKGSKQLVMKMVEPLKGLSNYTAEEDDWEGSNTVMEDVFEKIREKKKAREDEKITGIIDRLGRG